MGGRVLTKAEVHAKREALFQFVQAAARNGEVLPSMEKLGQLLRMSHMRVRNLLADLHDAGRIHQKVLFVRGVGNVRIARIVGTDYETAARKPNSKVGKATLKLMSYNQDKRAESQALDAKLYGPILKDVNWLRHRGWVINREGKGYRVGNSLISAADIVAKAARERRLAGVAQ